MLPGARHAPVEEHALHAPAPLKLYVPTPHAMPVVVMVVALTACAALSVTEHGNVLDVVHEPTVMETFAPTPAPAMVAEAPNAPVVTAVSVSVVPVMEPVPEAEPVPVGHAEPEGQGVPDAAARVQY